MSIATVGKVVAGAMTVGNIIQPVMTYRDNRQKGNGVATSAIKSAAETALYMSPIGNWMMAYDAVKFGSTIALNAGSANTAHSAGFYKAQFGGNFNLSQNGYTMRQRGLNILGQSNNSLRQSLGSEARSFHKGNFY